MFVENKQTIQPLNDGLTLKSVHTLEDVERWAMFQGHIHGEGVAAMSQAMILHHPATRPEQWLYIEEDATRRIVSALCLIPWRWRYEEAELKVGEVGIVATLEEFRNRGLSRALTIQHRALLQAGSYDISHIQGIPYFYRQFGYEYAMPLEGGYRLELRDVHESESNPMVIRPAGEADIPVLIRFYQAAADDLAISAYRSDAEWRYLLTHSLGTEMAVDYFLVIDAAGQPAGYVGVQRFGFGEGLNVNEVSRLNSATAAAVLGFLKGLAVERGKLFIRLMPPGNSTLQKVAAAWGAQNTGRYAWQINIPNVARLLGIIGPVLERRIAQSALAGYTSVVPINLYRETVLLHLEAGNLAQVETVPGKQMAGINVPPLLFAPLVLGWRTAGELAAIYPDFSVWAEWKLLVDVLFPRLESYLYSPY